MDNNREYDGLLGDIWAFGVSVYAIITGQFPYDESALEEIRPAGFSDKLVRGTHLLPS